MLQLFTIVFLLHRVSGVLAPARPFPGADAPLQLCLNLVDCFLESFVFKRLNFKFGPGYCWFHEKIDKFLEGKNTM